MPDTSVFPTLAEVVVFHHALGLTGVVFVGFSLGVLPAQSLAQTRPGARGAVLCYSALPLRQWGDNWPARWPDGVRLQLHILEGDEDVEIAKVLAAAVDGADLFLYPGTEHYFAEHDDQAAALLTRRVLDLLATQWSVLFAERGQARLVRLATSAREYVRTRPVRVTAATVATAPRARARAG
jgi:dienelactone hydrolase